MKFYLYPYIQEINLNLRRRCGQTEIVSHCSLLMSLAPAEQSIQISYRCRATICFISYHQLKTCYPKTINLNNFLYTVSYQQTKTWSLLSEGNQFKSYEKVWANWNCLSLVTSHVVGTSRAQHTTSYMSYKQMKTLSLFTTRQPICFFVIDHFSCR